MRSGSTRNGGGLRAAPRGTSRALAALLSASGLLAAAPAASAQAPAEAPPAPESTAPAPEAQPSPAPPRAVRLSRGSTTRWAFVERRTYARMAPGNGAKRLMKLQTTTPERTANLVVTLASVEADGRRWVRVRLPMLPNNTLGWVPRNALGGYEVVRTHLRVDTRRQTLKLLSRGRTVFRARVGVGQRRWPTPKGRFYVRNELRGFSSPVYGPVAFGTSARSAVLTDWPGGGFVGIHGTNQPGILPGRVSHGCIRLRNPDILRLARLMPVGTPITIR